MTLFERRQEERRRVEDRLQKMERALSFYADNANYRHQAVPVGLDEMSRVRFDLEMAQRPVDPREARLELRTMMAVPVMEDDGSKARRALGHNAAPRRIDSLMGVEL